MPNDFEAKAPLHAARDEARQWLANELPARWRGRERFVVLETGFGVGERFLALLAAWRADAARCERLFYVGLEAQPALPRAAELQAQWPPRTPGWQRLDFDGGRVQLLLAWGDAAENLAQVQAEVDAFWLGDFAAGRGPWRERDLAPLARLAAPGASAVSPSDAPGLHAALSAAGFVPRTVAASADGPALTVAAFAPVHRMRQPAGLAPLAPGAREAVVIGAGLAGAACARALADAGLAVQVFDAGLPAGQASGNPGGLFHATVHADDGPHARWSRQAALRCRAWLKRHPPPWQQDGLLRLSPGEPQAVREQLAARLDLDPLLAEPHAQGWWFPNGGALPPADWVRTLLHGIPVREHAPIGALQALPDGRWRLLDPQDDVLAETALLVLAPGAALPRLLEPLDPELAALLQTQRGQLSRWSQEAGPAFPQAAGGYVLSLPNGDLLGGATAQQNDEEPALRDADHAHNRAVAERLLGRPLQAPSSGRVGWRLLAPDKQPLVGGLIDPTQRPPVRATQVAHWARRPGLLVCGALGSRGITSAPLAAELLVAQALGWPWPLPRQLAAALDPARFAVRRARREDV